MDKILKIENNEANQKALFDKGYVWGGYGKDVHLAIQIKNLNEPYLYVHTKTRYIIHSTYIKSEQNRPLSNVQEVWNIEEVKTNLIQLLNETIQNAYDSFVPISTLLITPIFQDILLEKKLIEIDYEKRCYRYQNLIVKRCLDMGDNMFEVY